MSSPIYREKKKGKIRHETFRMKFTKEEYS
jgi:hypothetical protein